MQDQLAKITPVFDAGAAALPGTRMVDYAMTQDDVFLTDDGRTTYALVYPQAVRELHRRGAGRRDEADPGEGKQGDRVRLRRDRLQPARPGHVTTPRHPACWPRRCSAASARWRFWCSCSRRSSRWCRCSSPPSRSSPRSRSSCCSPTSGDISFVVQFLIALVGLGVAVDYSLLVVNRWREERAHGRDNHEAVVVAMQYAGHAVVASAGTVAISLCALLVIPVPLLRSMGVGGMLIPLVSTAVCLTLLPAMLGGIGPRVDWPRIRHEEKPSRRVDRLGAADRAPALDRRRASRCSCSVRSSSPSSASRSGRPRRARWPAAARPTRRSSGCTTAGCPGASCRRWRCWSRARVGNLGRAGGDRGRRGRRRGDRLRPGQRPVAHGRQRPWPR